MAIYRMAKALKEMGENPMIVSGGNINGFELFDEIPLWRVDTEQVGVFESKKYQLAVICIYENYILQKKVNRICKEQDIDIIQYAGNNGTGMFHDQNVPAVMRVSSYYELCYGDFLSYSKSEVVLHSFFERMAMKRMNGIYCPSNMLAQYLSGILKRKIRVIETVFFIEEKEEDFRFYEKLADKKYILFYGSISPQKGALEVAEAMNRVLKERTEFYLVVIGKDVKISGQSTKKMMKSKIDSKVQSRVIFYSAMEHKHLYPIIKNAYAVLQPSYMENLSNACMESMAFGKIVIGTYGTSYEQLIKDGQNGFLVKVKDADSLYEGIYRLLSLPEEDKFDMEKKALERIRQLRPEISARKLLEYYSKIIAAYMRK